MHASRGCVIVDEYVVLFLADKYSIAIGGVSNECCILPIVYPGANRT